MMKFNPNHRPYSSHRSVTYGKNRMVATSQPLAAQAGLDIMKKSGNAIDAAIATAAEQVETVHTQVEALKLAFTAGINAITDPKYTKTDNIDSSWFGRGQIILRDPKNNVLIGVTESRCDGAVVAY